MQDTYKDARDKWLTARGNFEEAIRLLESMLNLVEYQHIELDKAFAEFMLQQSKKVHELKNLRSVKEVKRR